jgi:hypothetical protein
MSHIADDIRSEQWNRFRAMTPAERVAMAERLGKEGLASYMEATGASRADALRTIRMSRRIGRKPSRCMDER